MVGWAVRVVGSGSNSNKWPEIWGPWIGCDVQERKGAGWELGRGPSLMAPCLQALGLGLVPGPGLAGAWPISPLLTGFSPRLSVFSCLWEPGRDLKALCDSGSPSLVLPVGRGAVPPPSLVRGNLC